MKKHRFIALILTILITAGTLAACANTGSGTTDGAVTPPPADGERQPIPAAEPPEVLEAPVLDELTLALQELGLDENYRFTETRTITVAVFDRGNDGGSPPDDNPFSRWIQERMLEKHNVQVEWKRIGRWTANDEYPPLLAAGDCPDIGFNYDYDIFMRTFADMGAIKDLYPYLSEYSWLFPNLFGFLGTEYIYYNMDPETKEVFAFTGKRKVPEMQATFMREDWLAKLGLDEPKTLQEFEDCLIAFRDNAELLLGAEADRMIPFLMSYDVVHQYRPILDGFLPHNIDDKDKYVHGYLNYLLSYGDYSKQTLRLLNRWYNDDLMWKDFGMYNRETLGSVAIDRIKQGHVGAMVTGTVNEPFRGGEGSWQYELQNIVGPEAALMAVNPFVNETGQAYRHVAPNIDRHIFMPITNEEPIASFLYLDFVSSLEARKYLTTGKLGVNYEVLEDGTIMNLGASGEWIMNSLLNIDYTLTVNCDGGGPSLDDPEIEGLSAALDFANVDPEYVKKTYEYNLNPEFHHVAPNFNLGTIDSESGKRADLDEKRNNMFINAIAATPENFDTVFDTGMQDLMNSGLEAIIKERTAMWERYYGSAVNIE